MDGCGDPRRVIRKNFEKRRNFPQFSQMFNYSGKTNTFAADKRQEHVFRIFKHFADDHCPTFDI